MELRLVTPLFQFYIRVPLLFRVDLRLLFFTFVFYNYGRHLGHALFSSYSYWDWLPLEIQERIITLSIYQFVRDMNNESGRNELHEDLLTYHRLKEVWALGHLKCKITKCGLKYKEACPGYISLKFDKSGTIRHWYILAYYVDRHNKMKCDFLGHTYAEAFRRMSHVKSYLYLVL